MKRIIICCDGTWNSADEQDHDQCATNVAKIAELVAPVDSNGIHQITYYHHGVGSGNLEDKITGGAFGVGLSKNITDAYRFIASNYVSGDEIWLFGFSRGAYTARSIIGLIRNSGLLQKVHLDKIPLAYELYRNRSSDTGPNSSQAKSFRDAFSIVNNSNAGTSEPVITFLGVWDTVGSLGIPDFVLSKFLGHKWNFHDVSLSSIVKNAYHAVSIDERREDFKPCLWTSGGGTNSEQVWFPGVHSDVGGGYPESGLSDCALAWMMCRARTCGLAFDGAAVNVQADVSAVMHDSKKGLFDLRGEYVRPVDPGVISYSASARLKAGNYQPKNWPETPTAQSCPNADNCQNQFRCF